MSVPLPVEVDMLSGKLGKNVSLILDLVSNTTTLKSTCKLLFNFIAIHIYVKFHVSSNSC